MIYTLVNIFENVISRFQVRSLMAFYVFIEKNLLSNVLFDCVLCGIFDALNIITLMVELAVFEKGFNGMFTKCGYYKTQGKMAGMFVNKSLNVWL